MPKYKAIVLDLDGTTIPGKLNGMPSEKVVEAVKKAHKKVAVCIATERSLFASKAVIEKLELTHPAILLGGALIVDCKTYKTIREQYLHLEDIEKVVKILKNYDVVIKVDEEGQFYEYDPKRKLKYPTNLLVFNYLTRNKADEIAHNLSHISTISIHIVHDWAKGYFGLNIGHGNATKQYAIFELAKLLKIETHEMIGVGDGPNDFSLLMACGLKVAMGNASEDLKAIADYIAPSVEEDGVVDVIEKFVLK